jgi:hypothetical protein
MRVAVAVCLAFGLTLASVPASAQEAEVLRRELDQLKQQFQTMQEQYQKMIQGFAVLRARSRTARSGRRDPS